MHECGQHDAALSTHLRALGMRQKLHEYAPHPEVLNSLLSVARALQALGKTQEATAMMQRANDMQEALQQQEQQL